ncbi:MAG TPA: hypothetical protein VGF56_05095 [Rhizomicrobium sp.]|jgi:hypothetical protein
MPFAKSAQPRGGKQALRKALRRRIHSRHPLRAFRKDVRAAAALPLHVLRSAAAGAPLSRAARSGWWYPMLASGKPAIAFMRGKDRPRFAGMTSGKLAENLFRAAKRAERDLSGAGQTYAPRLIEIPSLRIIALWLYAPRGHSRYVLLAHGRARARPDFVILDSLEQAREAARKAAPRKRRRA